MIMDEKAKCIECGICSEKCGLKIEPMKLLLLYNDYLGGNEDAVRKEVAKLPEGKAPWNCFCCGTCEFYCPEHIAVWKYIGSLANLTRDKRD